MRDLVEASLVDVIAVSVEQIEVGRDTGSEVGRTKDIVLERLRFGFSISLKSSNGGSGFLTSGSLYSSLLFLSDAKYSSPRPNTTCREAKSRVLPFVGKSHSCSDCGRS